MVPDSNNRELSSLVKTSFYGMQGKNRSAYEWLTEAWATNSLRSEKFQLDSAQLWCVSYWLHLYSELLVARYIAAAWCKDVDGTMKLCPQDNRRKWMQQRGLFDGSVAAPYIRLGLKYMDQHASTLCASDLYLQLMICQTCCCLKGLVISDKMLSLSMINESYTPTKGKVPEPMSTLCKNWFTFMDVIVGSMLSILRASQSIIRNVTASCS